MNIQANSNSPGNLSVVQHNNLIRQVSAIQEGIDHLGHPSLYEAVLSHGFVRGSGRFVIPETHRVVRNRAGTVWGIEKKPATVAADEENELLNEIKRAINTWRTADDIKRAVKILRQQTALLADKI